MDRYTFISDYRDDRELRTSFEELAKRTFGIDFEEWYQQGYWGEAYRPYSLMDGRKIISNVSVNKMPFTLCGQRKLFLQLGTVMTDTDYRGQGLNRKLLERVMEEYKNTCDGIYLFANDSVLDYYPKFGFQKAVEYRYSKTVRNTGSREAVIWPLSRREDYDSVEKIIRRAVKSSLFEMNNIGLTMFYLTYFMKNSLYYIRSLNTYVIAEEEAGVLFLHQVISEEEVELEEVIGAFGDGIKKVVLGFVPQAPGSFERDVLKEEDTTLFIFGDGWNEFKREGLRFPALSHA